MSFSYLWGWLLGRDRTEQIDALNLSDREIALQSLIFQLANKLEDALLHDGEARSDRFQSGAWALIKKAREDIKE